MLLGGLPSSGTVVLTNVKKNTPKHGGVAGSAAPPRHNIQEIKFAQDLILAANVLCIARICLIRASHYPRWKTSVFGVFFQNIGKTGQPGRREAPQSTSFDETSRIKTV